MEAPESHGSQLFFPTAWTWLTHILAVEVSIYEIQGRLNWSHFGDYFFLHFPCFPHPYALGGISFFLSFFFKEQNINKTLSRLWVAAHNVLIGFALHQWSTSGGSTGNTLQSLLGKLEQRELCTGGGAGGGVGGRGLGPS